MITQIKEWGGSLAIVIPKDFCKFHQLKKDEWVDIGDIVKVNKDCSLVKELRGKDEVIKIN